MTFGTEDDENTVLVSSKQNPLETVKDVRLMFAEGEHESVNLVGSGRAISNTVSVANLVSDHDGLDVEIAEMIPGETTFTDEEDGEERERTAPSLQIVLEAEGGE